VGTGSFGIVFQVEFSFRFFPPKFHCCSLLSIGIEGLDLLTFLGRTWEVINADGNCEKNLHWLCLSF
jgi:hypothetical protein